MGVTPGSCLPGRVIPWKEPRQHAAPAPAVKSPTARSDEYIGIVASSSSFMSSPRHQSKMQLHFSLLPGHCCGLVFAAIPPARFVRHTSLLCSPTALFQQAFKSPPLPPLHDCPPGAKPWPRWIMSWLRTVLALGSFPTAKRPRTRVSGLRVRMARKNHLALSTTASSNSPGPWDSASQRRKSGESNISFRVSFSLSPTTTASFISTSAVSASESTPFDSSSEPSGGYTTPPVDKAGGLKLEDLIERGLSQAVSHLLDELSPPASSLGSKQHMRMHQDTRASKGKHQSCAEYGRQEMEEVFVCYEDDRSRPTRNAGLRTDVSPTT
jgi:hypothetical protein